MKKFTKHFETLQVGVFDGELDLEIKINHHNFFLTLEQVKELKNYLETQIDLLVAELATKTCSNCAHRISEECGIDGHEVYDDTTCNNHCLR